MAYGTIESTESSDEGREISPPLYSIFTTRQKRVIVFLTAYTAMFSPLSSFIYYPAIASIASSLHVSIELLNLTITSYLVVSGIAPTLLGDVADMIGRRPVYLSILSIYVGANIGLALVSSYAALVVLRMLQSFGASATIAIAYGIIADIAPPAERGSYTGTVFLGPNISPLLGPVLGGVILDNWGWKWIFWFLAILSGICFLLLAFLLPETSRKIVGNGSIRAYGMHKTLLAVIWPSMDPATREAEFTATKRSFYTPNPLATLYIIMKKDTALIMVMHGTFYTTFSCLQASMSPLFIRVYGLTASQAGLIYLPCGSACLLASYLSGRVMNRDYKLTAKAHQFTIDERGGDNLSDFPIEKARLRSACYLVPMVALCILAYGWAVQQKMNLSIPLIFHSFFGLHIVGMFNSLTTLLTDLHPTNPSTAQAALNIIRCSLSAAGLSVLQPVLDGLGPGWCFSIIAGIVLGTLPLLWMERE